MGVVLDISVNATGYEELPKPLLDRVNRRTVQHKDDLVTIAHDDCPVSATESSSIPMEGPVVPQMVVEDLSLDSSTSMQ